MNIKRGFVGILFIILILGNELGAKCEAERIPFVAEVGRYHSSNLDSWISSSTPSTRRKKFS